MFPKGTIMSINKIKKVPKYIIVKYETNNYDIKFNIQDIFQL